MQLVLTTISSRVTWYVVTLTMNMYNKLQPISFDSAILVWFAWYADIFFLTCVMLHILLYSQTDPHPIGEVQFEDIHGVPLDLVVLDLIHCKRTNVEHVVSDPTQVRNGLGSLWNVKSHECTKLTLNSHTANLANLCRYTAILVYMWVHQLQANWTYLGSTVHMSVRKDYQFKH